MSEEREGSDEEENVGTFSSALFTNIKVIREKEIKIAIAQCEILANHLCEFHIKVDAYRLN